MRRFLMFVRKDPEEFLGWCRSRSEKWEILEALQAFIRQFESRRYGTCTSGYTALRSFLLHNHIDVPRDLAFQIHAETPPVERQITLDNLRELIGLAVQPWRSMLLVKWHGLMDTEALIYTSDHYSELLAQAVREDRDVCKITIPGRKKRRNKRPFYTFIDAEALHSLKEYFERDRGYPKPGEPIWLNRRDKHRMTKNAFEIFWLRHLRRAGLIPKPTGDSGSRYGYNVHNTRDLAISLLATVPNLKPICPEFWAGHNIDPLQYNQFYSVKPIWVEEQYRLATPYLNITSSVGPMQPPTALLDRIEQLEFAIKLLQDASGYNVEAPKQRHPT